MQLLRVRHLSSSVLRVGLPLCAASLVVLGTLAATAGAVSGGGGGGKPQVKPQIACGGAHTVALKSDGSLWSWGLNGYGQLGLGTSGTSAHSTPARVGTDSSWTAVACGDYHTWL